MNSSFSSLLKPVVGGSLDAQGSPAQQVQAYHRRTMHGVKGYAAGPDTLDWDAQPQPFRTWAGSPRTMLPLQAETWPATWQDLREGRVSPAPFSRDGLALLLQLSFGLTAWKQLGPDRWALRANPSSGNLHPTEVYVIAQAVTGLPDGLYHYEPREHALSQRAAGTWATTGPMARPGLWLGLASVAWREAWKYGERAFRYVQLDTGHALGAVRYAAAALGWGARLLPSGTDAALRASMGLDREADFGQAEREEAEGLIELTGGPDPSPWSGGPDVDWPRWPADTRWQGQASMLDPQPLYRWPVIEQVMQATRSRAPSRRDPVPAPGTRPVAATDMALAALRDAQPASQIILGRRSAQHFERRATMAHAAFLRLVAALLPQSGGPTDLPWDTWPWAPAVHVVIYAHRVDGLPPGAYILPRSEAGLAPLQSHLMGAGGVNQLPDLPEGLPLRCLAEHPALAGTLRTLSCHQAIASDACVAFSLIAEFQGPINADPAAYRRLLQEAGLIGQALYLQAEAEGLRGTGIGCYFDESVHELLGLKDDALQVLYHFTVGQPLSDSRLQTEPPYTPERQRLDTPWGLPDGSPSTSSDCNC